MRLRLLKLGLAAALVLACSDDEEKCSRLGCLDGVELVAGVAEPSTATVDLTVCVNQQCIDYVLSGVSPGQCGTEPYVEPCFSPTSEGDWILRVFWLPLEPAADGDQLTVKLEERGGAVLLEQSAVIDYVESNAPGGKRCGTCRNAELTF